jgi:hypothetical protein
LITFADVIVDPSACRVFARSAFAYGHDPEAAVAGEAELLAVAWRRLHPSVRVLPPHAATSKPLATITPRVSAADLLELVLISSSSSGAKCARP